MVDALCVMEEIDHVDLIEDPTQMHTESEVSKSTQSRGYFFNYADSQSRSTATPRRRGITLTHLNIFTNRIELK